ncbi:androgen-dependent TFPI-regulating protein-like [Anthonomus grandis grandis]|uniref:androgen-dependent TFPI-regulating protein-like n=1 Tax=Anthonomus grandis grandis TaxID=2921223 RepID=UPI002165F5C8|nr:androgen-dependent TFPI-regulating protein-like [Anthonomus grandis grandis]
MSLQTIGHLVIAAHFWYGCYYDWFYVNIPKEIHDSGDSSFNTKKLKFLTYWDAILQSIFFTICFLNDIIGSNESTPKKAPLIRKVKDIVFSSLAFPLSMFVGLSFWGLYLIDRELIFPTILDKYFPSWLNHLMHTNIMIFSLLEMLVSYRKYPSRKIGLTITVSFMLVYLGWIHYINSRTNKWVYPILNVLPLPARICFFILNFVVIVFCYILGEKINLTWWERKNKKVTNKKFS